jgi:hypothetical protein
VKGSSAIEGQRRVRAPRRGGTTAAIVGAALLACTPSSTQPLASSPAVDALQRYCIAHGARAADALAAADRDGWTAMPPSDNGARSRAKTVDGAHFLLIVATDPNRALRGVSDHSCVIVTADGYDNVLAALARFARVAAIDTGPRRTTFAFLEGPGSVHAPVSPERIGSLVADEIRRLRIVGVETADRGNVALQYMTMSVE